MQTFAIAGRKIGADQPPFIIAELSGNHNGSMDRALRLIDAAAAAKADAVKLQTYTADTITINSDSDDFLIKGGPWGGRRLYDLYQEASTPWGWHEQLFAHARAQGLIVFSSPFDHTAVDFLERLSAPAYKIASFECIDLPLIRKAARTGKPLIVSTGMANREEIADAVQQVVAESGTPPALLHCVSAYPAPANEYNLRCIPQLARDFETIAGLSDHTLGGAVAAAAVALGAAIVEKHFTLARADGGPDAEFSLEPDELAVMVRDCRTAWEAIGEAHYRRTSSEAGSMIFRRSLYAVGDIAGGESFTTENFRSIRPGYGLSPKEYDKVLGRRAKRDIKRGTALTWDLID